MFARLVGFLGFDFLLRLLGSTDGIECWDLFFGVLLGSVELSWILGEGRCLVVCSVCVCVCVCVCVSSLFVSLYWDFDVVCVFVNTGNPS